MNVVAIIQARVGSTRLPGKVLFELAGKTVLAHVIQRIKEAPGVDKVVIATTNNKADDAVVEEALRQGALVYRGSEDDVLSRYYEAARQYQADVVVRITSDCPLIDPAIVGEMIARFAQAGAPIDYLSNSMKRTYPRGMDAEVFTMTGLARAWKEARTPAEREHVTPYFYRHPGIFRLADHCARSDWSRYRLTLDTQEDWKLIQKIVDALDGGRRLPGMAEVVAYLERNPQLAALNAAVEQKSLGH